MPNIGQAAKYPFKGLLREIFGHFERPKYEKIKIKKMFLTQRKSRAFLNSLTVIFGKKFEARKLLPFKSGQFTKKLFLKRRICL